MLITKKKPRSNPATSPFAVGAAFAGMGVLHFLKPEGFDTAVPEWIPMPARQATLVSGALEIAGGLGLMLPPTRRLASIGLIGLLAGVFPANIHMAQHSEKFAPVPSWALYARLPLQPLMAWQVWRAGGVRRPH